MASVLSIQPVYREKANDSDLRFALLPHIKRKQEKEIVDSSTTTTTKIEESAMKGFQFELERQQATWSAHLEDEACGGDNDRNLRFRECCGCIGSRDVEVLFGIMKQDGARSHKLFIYDCTFDIGALETLIQRLIENVNLVSCFSFSSHEHVLLRKILPLFAKEGTSIDFSIEVGPFHIMSMPPPNENLLDATVSPQCESLAFEIVNDMCEFILPLHRLSSLCVGPCRMSNNALDLFQRSIRTSRISKLTLSLLGGSFGEPEATIHYLTSLILNMPRSTIELELLLSDEPQLFHYNVNELSQALIHMPKSILALNNVGITEKSCLTILEATTHMKHSGSHLWITGEGLMGREGFQKFLKILPQMEAFETLSIVDQNPFDCCQKGAMDASFQQLQEELFLRALQKNPSLQYINFDVGDIFTPSNLLWSKLSRLWKRNEIYDRARSTFSKIDRSAVPYLIQALGHLDEGFTSTYFVVRSMTLCAQVSFNSKIHKE